MFAQPLEGSVKCSASAVAIYDQSLFTAEGNKIHCRTMAGVSNSVLSLNENDGQVVSMSVNGSFLVGATNKGIIRLWDLSKREPKPYGVSEWSILV